VAQFIYVLEKARKAHGDKVVLDNVTLNFLPGVKIGVVGPNGAGKSSLLKIMAGIDTVSNGEARLMPGYSVGMLAQEPPLNDAKTVLGNIEEAVAETKAKLERFNKIAEQMATDYTDELMEEMGKLQEELDHSNAWDVDSQLELAMDALRCPPPEADVTQLSGGERRRVALCKLLLEAPDLLLLDEPTNHLDAESVQWLEQHLAKYAGTVIAITHDRYFLDNVATWILELDRGRAFPYEGNYSTYLDKKAARLKLQGRKDQKLQKRLENELEWVRSNAKARQTKSKARLDRYEEMATEAEKTRKLDFEEIQIPPGPRLGNTVIETKDLVKGFDDRVQRHRRHHRPERRRQDHAVQDHRRAGAAGRRPGPGRRDRQAVVRGPEPFRTRRVQDGVGGGLRRSGPHDGRQGRDAVPRLRRRLRLQGARPAEAGQGALRR
jgi:ATPase subunit of ABC transporter with duplicated ATPase domains